MPGKESVALNSGGSNVIRHCLQTGRNFCRQVLLEFDVSRIQNNSTVSIVSNDSEWRAIELSGNKVLEGQYGPSQRLEPPRGLCG